MNTSGGEDFAGNGFRINYNDLSFGDFLDRFKAVMKSVFYDRADINRMAITRGLPPFVLREIMNLNPLAVAIPAEFGGRGGKIEENLALLSAASYESLALSLTMGINSALFIQPVAKYGQSDIKQPVFDRFLYQQNMGGLMITEPGYGSDALNMQTSYRSVKDGYHIQGTKHWAGLTGWAEFWLLTAREMSDSGDLKRDIDFFVCDVTREGQQIVVEEVYENLGLYQIPYGRNLLNLTVPESHRLVPETTGVKMMLDLLHRSRMQFPGMAMGFIQRMLDESIVHTSQRNIGGRNLLSYDQVQHRLSRLQASYTVCSAMCLHSSARAGIENDLATSGFEANSIKTVITDHMQEAAQSATQLVGAQAYKLSHIAGRGITDSRPFQIFEGSNDILYAQISEQLVKMMKKARETNLFRFLSGFELTRKSADRLRKMFDFELNLNLPQRKQVELGQILGRLVSTEMVLNLGEKGFRKDLVNNAVELLQQEMTAIMGSFGFDAQTRLVESYQEESSWFDLARRKSNGIPGWQYI